MPKPLIISSMAAPNIALIKYWGKRDNLLKLPLNDSVSITLDENVLASTTTLVFSSPLLHDRYILNGAEVPDEHIAEAMLLIRRRLGSKYPIINKPIILISSNNFPTAAGIASSASGFAALAQAVSSALGISDMAEKSILARLGSGSASRSIFGGYARWKAGDMADGSDSYAVQIAPRSKWPEIVDLIAITSSEKKKVSSKDGMERTMQTSDLCHCRLDVVGKRADQVESAIRTRDFMALANATMRDSNAMHATMLDTWPPVMYMNDVSRDIIYALNDYNVASGCLCAAYTFDAGPNAHIITTRKNAGKIMRLLKKIKGVKRVISAGVGEGSKTIATPKKNKLLVARLLGK